MEEILFRAVCYAVAGMVGEVVFTAIMSRSLKLEGFTSLWASLLYGSAVFLFEWPYHYLYPMLLFDFGWFLRGVIYVPLLYVAEGIYLWIIEKIIREKPWFYTGPGAEFGGRINFAYAPIWFLATLGAEWYADFLHRIGPYVLSQF